MFASVHRSIVVLNLGILSYLTGRYSSANALVRRLLGPKLGTKKSHLIELNLETRTHNLESFPSSTSSWNRKEKRVVSGCQMHQIGYFVASIVKTYVMYR
jgi:hypothetical protein